LSLLLDEFLIALIGVVDDVIGGGEVVGVVGVFAECRDKGRFIRRRSDKSYWLTWEMYDVPRGTVS